MKNALLTTLIDITGALQAHELQYALVGGLAASLRGRTRVTDDVDLVILCDVERALGLLGDLDPKRFAPLLPDVEKVIRTTFLMPLLHQETLVQLDLAVGVSGFEQQIVARATIVKLGGKAFRVATAEDLLLMKLLAGRPQDDQDVRGIVEVQSESIDWDYCIVVAGQLEEAVGIDLVKRVRSLRGS